jgi:hypothetical protein
MMKRSALGLVVAALALGSATASAHPAAAPTIKITYPSHCACGIAAPQTSTVLIVATITGFKLAPAAFGKAPVPGEGHTCFSLDNGKFDRPAYTAGATVKLAVKAGTVGKCSPSLTNKITYTNLPSGPHTVVAYLVSNNNKKLGPSDKESFKVQ